jgi:hypothetical protein
MKRGSRVLERATLSLFIGSYRGNPKATSGSYRFRSHADRMAGNKVWKASRPGHRESG